MEEISIPWIPSCKLEFVKDNLTHQVFLNMKNLETRTVCVFKGGLVCWPEPKDKDFSESGAVWVNSGGAWEAFKDYVKLMDAERLCFSVMPKNSEVEKFSSILKDPFWQSVLDLALVEDIMEE